MELIQNVHVAHKDRKSLTNSRIHSRTELYADDREPMMLSGASPSPLARHNRTRLRLDLYLSLTGLNNPLIFIGVGSLAVRHGVDIALHEFFLLTLHNVASGDLARKDKGVSASPKLTLFKFQWMHFLYLVWRLGSSSRLSRRVGTCIPTHLVIFTQHVVSTHPVSFILIAPALKKW